MHSHNVWSSETLHVLEYLWEGTVLEQHRVLLREGEEGRRGGGEEGRRGGEGEERVKGEVRSDTFGGEGT